MVSNTGKKVSMQGKFVSIALQTVKLNLQGDRQEPDRLETAPYSSYSACGGGREMKDHPSFHSIYDAILVVME